MNSNKLANWQWDDVRFFLAVARAGSLSAAARMLGVGHVTVGRRVALLEKRLGVTLLNQTPDGFATTSAGQAILQQCTAMESAALDIERAAAGRDSLVTGSVRVTTTEALAYLLVAPIVAALRQTHPDLQIDLNVGVRSLDIARRESDLAIRFARPAASELVCRKLGEVGFSLYASQRYLAKSGIPKRGQGLGGYDLITFTRAPPQRARFSWASHWTVRASRSAAIIRSSSSRPPPTRQASPSLLAFSATPLLTWSAFGPMNLLHVELRGWSFTKICAALLGSGSFRHR